METVQLGQKPSDPKLTAQTLAEQTPAKQSLADMRRGACPALSTPMMTGDGFLARVALTDAISPKQLAELCRLAIWHGNGMLDISARGNLQIRGLGEISAPKLDADVRAMNLPLRDGLAVETPPLAGMDGMEIADPRPLAQAIRDGASGITGLAPKMTVVVDGGGRLRLSELLADIRLMAVRADGEVLWKLLLGGSEESGRLFNVLRETQAVAATVEILQRMAAMGRSARGRDLAADLPLRDDAGPVANPPRSSSHLSRGSDHDAKHDPSQMLGTSPSMTEIFGAATSPFDLFALSDDLHAIGIGPAFGQVKAEALATLCEEAACLGITQVKPALDHSLLFFGAKNACEALQKFAAVAGFITRADDPRGHIAACPGSPACRSATIPTHDIAAEAARDCADLLDGSFTLHITGCHKGCAHPQASALALCGTADGVSFVADGKASDAPFAYSAFVDTNATLRRLAELVKSERRAGENSAACLARIGSNRLGTQAQSGQMPGRP
ncbi:precorrin-3B synthase [Neorhizobium alkalisoli]|uniref:Precorrin-3B synthase n=1 Tax=Neorhizobium alkalisoli TaxID=528178 RepID=A0A561PZ52_9HYPH|nr:precorrin-3B synthase [Neorhizobium alkalisoli]TWF43396.1 precorrin-3B synthase [Neorhizobium alkalisoli]